MTTVSQSYRRIERQTDRQTDERTDGRLTDCSNTARNAHSASRGKKSGFGTTVLVKFAAVVYSTRDVAGGRAKE